MKFSQTYLLEYLDTGWGSGASMGSAVDSMNKRYAKILRRQAKSKKSSQALKDVQGILKRLRKYEI